MNIIVNFREINVNFFVGAPKMMRYDGLIVPGGNPHHVAPSCQDPRNKVRNFFAILETVSLSETSLGFTLCGKLQILSCI